MWQARRVGQRVSFSAPMMPLARKSTNSAMAMTASTRAMPAATPVKPSPLALIAAFLVEHVLE